MVRSECAISDSAITSAQTSARSIGRGSIEIPPPSRARVKSEQRGDDLGHPVAAAGDPGGDLGVRLREHAALEHHRRTHHDGGERRAQIVAHIALVVGLILVVMHFLTGRRRAL